MILTLALKATVILALGSVVLLLLPRTASRVRHMVCTLTVLDALLLPLFLRAPVPIPGYRFNISAESLSLTPTVRSFPIQEIWMAGVAVCLLRFAVGVAYLSWKTRRAAGPGDIRLAAVQSPMVWGWFRPTILMPAAAERWSVDRWNLAMAHERAHVDRLDIWTSTLAVIAEAVYWFHPLMWWLTRRMREEQELACDERVLEQGGDGIAYAELLVETAGMPESRLFGCRMNGGKMKERLGRILTWQRAASWSRAKEWTALTACAMLLIGGALLGPALAPAATTSTDTNGPSVTVAHTPDGPPYKIGGKVTAPVLITKHEPEYDKAAKDAKVQGKVLLNITINSDGVPENVHVIKSLEPGLDQNAVAAVSGWRFKPAELEGKPVPVTADVEVNYRLK